MASAAGARALPRPWRRAEREHCRGASDKRVIQKHTHAQRRDEWPRAECARFVDRYDTPHAGGRGADGGRDAARDAYAYLSRRVPSGSAPVPVCARCENAGAHSLSHSSHTVSQSGERPRPPGPPRATQVTAGQPSPARRDTRRRGGRVKMREKTSFVYSATPGLFFTRRRASFRCRDPPAGARGGRHLPDCRAGAGGANARGAPGARDGDLCTRAVSRASQAGHQRNQTPLAISAP